MGGVTVLSRSSVWDWIGIAAALCAGWYIFFRDKAPAEPPKIAPIVPLVTPREPALEPRPTGPVMVTITKTGAVWSLQSDTVKGKRTARFGWLYLDFSKDKTIRASHAREYYRANCETGEVKLLTRMDYNKAGNTVHTETYSEAEAEPSYYPPDTNGGAIVRELCSPRFGS